MILLLDIGNTHTHLGLANGQRVFKQANIPTASWFGGGAAKLLAKFAGKAKVSGAALCSVVPRATPHARKLIKMAWRSDWLVLSPKTVRGVGIVFPKPVTMGGDRLAYAVGVKRHYVARRRWWWILARQ